jgi:hypothetical protein
LQSAAFGFGFTGSLDPRDTKSIQCLLEKYTRIEAYPSPLCGTTLKGITWFIENKNGSDIERQKFAYSKENRRLYRIRGALFCSATIIGNCTGLSARGRMRFDELLLCWTDIMEMPVCCVNSNLEWPSVHGVTIFSEFRKRQDFFAGFDDSPPST